MPDAISRRRVLLATGATALLAAGAVPLWHAMTDARAFIRSAIMNHLRGVTIASGAVEEFIDDYLRHNAVRGDGVAIGNACDLSGLDDVAEPCVNNAAYLRRIEERVIDLFIRSTDVFAPDRRSSDPIRYVAFWDPYSGPCRNPFADLSPPG